MNKADFIKEFGQKFYDKVDKIVKMFKAKKVFIKEEKNA